MTLPSLVRTAPISTLPFQMRHARFLEGAPGEQGGGGGGTGEQGGQGGGQGGEQSGAGTGAPDGGGQGDQAPSWPEWDGKVESLPESIQELVRKERDDAAKQRRGKQSAEENVVGQLRQLLGLEESSKEPTVESLTTELQERAGQVTEQTQRADRAEADLAARDRELAVLRASIRLRTVDGDALLDSRDFLNSIKDLDPTANDQVEKAVKEYAAKHPRFQVRATGTSGVDHTAGSGTGTTRPNYSLAEATERTLAGLDRS